MLCGPLRLGDEVMVASSSGRRVSGSATLVRAARVLTADGAGVTEDCALLLRDGRIERVERGLGQLPSCGDIDVVDLGDVTLLPGLMDAHVHLAFDATGDVVGPMLGLDDAALHALMDDHAQRYLDVGVTTVRDLGDRRFGSLALREQYRGAPSSGPELLAAGPPLTRTQGHCWFLGGEADTADELRAAVAERAARGCDVVKVMATGGVITPGFLPHESQYDLAQLRQVVDAARERGLPTAAHAHGADGIRDSVAAGVHSVEHCTFFDETSVRPDWDVVRTMVDKGIFVTTTGAVLPGLAPPPMIAARIEQFRINVQRMRSMGASVVCTSDAGVGPSKPHGVLPHGVVEAARIGFSNAEALATVTSVAAALCGMTGRKGALAPGHDADLLAVHGDPLTNIADVQRVAAVFRAGVRVR